MESQTQNQQTNQQSNPNFISASQASQQLQDAMYSLTKLLTQIPDSLNALGREFRGEGLYQDKEGNNHWVQFFKPAFVVVDKRTGNPIMKKETMPWGGEKKIYIPNDEAINEILSTLKFMGANSTAPLGYNQHDNYTADLYEFECKLAALLAQKQKAWGLDKAMLPITYTRIKTFVQDVRSLAVDGKTMKALQTTVSRVEQSMEGTRPGWREKASPYG